MAWYHRNRLRSRVGRALDSRPFCPRYVQVPPELDWFLFLDIRSAFLVRQGLSAECVLLGEELCDPYEYFQRIVTAAVTPWSPRWFPRWATARDLNPQVPERTKEQPHPGWFLGWFSVGYLIGYVLLRWLCDLVP
jgi:hypothetical protein